MKRFLIRWILLAFSVVGASVITQVLGLPFHAEYGSVDAAIKLMIGVLVLSLLNATLGRILKFLTLPLSCITLGLFSLVVNALILWMAASLKLGFSIRDSKGSIDGFTAAFVASILISLFNGVLGVLVPDGDS